MQIGHVSKHLFSKGWPGCIAKNRAHLLAKSITAPHCILDRSSVLGQEDRRNEFGFSWVLSLDKRKDAYGLTSAIVAMGNFPSLRRRWAFITLEVGCGSGRNAST